MKWMIGVGLGLVLAEVGLAETQTVTQLPEMVVTPTGSESAAFDVPFTLATVEAARLASARTVPEVLRETPGVMVQKTGHGQGSPYLRGFTGFRTVFLMDGIRLNNSTFREGPNQYWNTVDPFSIERLEVVKGPSSVLYGSDAIGGTVNALTRSTPAEPTGLASYRFASAEDSHTGRAEAGSVAGPVSLRGGLTIKSYGDLRSGAGRQPRTGYDEWAADAKMELDLATNQTLIAAFQHVDQFDAWRTHRTILARNFNGTTNGNDRAHVFDQQRHLGYLQFRAWELAGVADSVTLSVSYQYQGENLTRVRSNGVRDLSDVDVQTLGFGAQLVSPSPVGTLTYGAEYYRDWVDSGQVTIATNGTLTTAIQGPVGDDASYALVGVYLQDDVPVGERVNVIVGGRYTYARAEANQVRDPVTGLATAVEDDWHHVAGSARLQWRVDEADRGRWFAGVSQGFRAPNLSDLTRLDIAQSGEIETAAPGLDPENFLALETGVKWQTDTVTAALSYFYTVIHDMIVRQPTGAIVSGANEVTKRNAGDGFAQGIEASGRWQVHPQWSVFAWVAWIEGEVDSFPTSAPVSSEEYLNKMMPLNGAAGVRWDEPENRFWAETLTLLSDEQNKLSSSDVRDNQRIPPGGTPGYGVWTIRAGWNVSSHFTVTAAVENILDKNYRVHGSGVNEPGRNVVVTGTARF